MGVDERERERAILDAATDLLLRLGYNKLTMGDVAEAVDLHRGLVYLRFKSKDELVEAIVHRELNRYADRWRDELRADPQGGSAASVLRATARALQSLPMAAAIVARDELIFGKYLRRPANIFERVRKPLGTHRFLRVMQEAGTIRPEVDVRSVAFILDAVSRALRHTFPHDRDADQPSSDDVLETLADLLDLGLTPSGGADLAAGKAILLDGPKQARADFADRDH